MSLLPLRIRFNATQTLGLIRISLILAALYFVFGQLAYLTSVANRTVTPILYAPEGIALAASILLGSQVWLGVFLGQLCLALAQDIDWVPALAVSSINALEATVGGLLFHRFKLKATLDSVRDWVGLQLLMFLVLQVCTALFAVFVLWWFGLIQDWKEFIFSWQNGWLGDCMGQSLLTPLLLKAFCQRRPWQDRLKDFALPFLVMPPTIGLIFFSFYAKGLTLPLVTVGTALILLGIYRNLLATAAGSILVATACLYFSNRGEGPFVVNGVLQLLDMNVFILGTGLIAQFIAVLLAERNGLQSSLTVAKHQAELANLSKSKFLAAASHDLRQPIHAQGLFLELLGRTDLTLQQRELLSYARASSESSNQMLNTLLDFSRIEAGVITPQIRPFLLQPLLNKLELELAPLSDKKGLIYRTRETTLAVQSDPILVEMILRNLISNAIRYTERGGLLVSCRRRKSQVVLEVWDTGIGIQAVHLKSIFDEFHQLGNPERDASKGLGLGLAIAQRLATSIQGELTLASTVQRGSVFRLTLTQANSAELSHISAALKPPVSLPPLHILVIDDNHEVRTSMGLLMRSWGCTCDCAEFIEEALQLARDNIPDIVISDMRLREQRTGLQAIALLRAQVSQSLPALLVSGDTAPERLLETQASGITLLHKPVLPEQLHLALLALLKKSQNSALAPV
jgi:signal transduction histidine kinase/CheY-like chemotaxis protein